MSIFNNPEENYWRNFATKTVLIGVTAILLIQVLRKHIRWVQAVSVLLLVTYLMLVFGSTVFMRQP